MKKTLVSLLYVGAFGAYVLLNASSSAHGKEASVTPPSGATIPDPAATQPPKKTTSAAAPVSAPIPAQKTGLYTDGAYTGSAADAYYGLVQVKATVAGGKLTNVSFLQYPSDRSTSVMINRQAMPVLAQEAITAQSAKVDGVSGASYTSTGFQQSLASALAKAKA